MTRTSQAAGGHRRASRIANRGWRDIVLFFVGVSGIIYETVATHGERPTLIIAFLGMAGAPIFLKTDEYQTAKDEAAKVNGGDPEPRPEVPDAVE